MKKISRKAKLMAAVIINVFLFAALAAIIVKNVDSFLLSVLVVSLTHISLCGSLLYFLYVSPAEDKISVRTTSDTMRYFAVPATK